MPNENKIEEIIKASLENIRSLADANTVIGDPYTTPGGVTIIPVSKISVGLATGGLDYTGKKEPKPQNFGGGGGTGLTISPIGFLVIGNDGRVDMIDIGARAPSDPVSQIADFIERSPEIIEKIKALFAKKDGGKTDKKEKKD